jgi:hypothetical protein
MFNIPNSRYNMLADVLHQQITQDESTGQIKRSWFFVADIRCIARGISGGGIRVVGSTERYGGGEYTDVEWVKVQTAHNLSKRDRITNIRTVDHQGRVVLVWEDTRYIEEEAIAIPIEFEVVGSSPVMDPFGRLIEYDALLQRAEVPSDEIEDVIDPDDPNPGGSDDVIVWE